MLQRTFAIVKPDAVARKLTGKIFDAMESANLRIIACRKLHLSQRQAETFYGVHRQRPFFADLCRYMQSGPVVVLVLEGPHAVQAYRDLMGATNPEQAAPGTLRRLFGESIERNAVHGSDAPETAAKEIAYFFAETDLFPQA